MEDKVVHQLGNYHEEKQIKKFVYLIKLGSFHNLLFQDDITNGYIYSIDKEECEKGSILIEYNSVKDIYYRNKIEENKKDGWIDRIYSCSNIQRKVERDWKKVYLSRKQLNSNGILSWLIQFKPEQENLYRFDRINIQCPMITFDEYAKVTCQLQIGNDLFIDLSSSINLFFSLNS